jgi:hypothetical protein
MAGDDDVGYRRPPKATRFKPGQSGNPKGRPRGSANLATDLAAELNEQITVREGGQAQRVNKQRALIKSLMAKALQGDCLRFTETAAKRGINETNCSEPRTTNSGRREQS